METYTKNQLVSAMAKYNAECLASPADFIPVDQIVNADEAAVDQVDYLLSLVEND